MKINHSVEREDGTFVFQGELEPMQVQYLVTLGINLALARGAVPFLHDGDRPLASIVPQDTEYPQ